MSDSPSSASQPPSRTARAIAAARWLAILALLGGLLTLVSALPVREASARLESWIAGLGLWGVAVFIAIYILATVLMLPGSPLSLVAGAVFGIWWGTAAISVASTTGAALAFLISRYVARDRIAARLSSYPKFSAIDRAIATGGWKIVALLRLSPAVPFNLQNYLYGLTRIRFVECVLTSWIAMLPGTFLYVYLGYLARKTAEAAGGADSAQDSSTVALQWGLRIVGILATIAVTVYVARLARRELARATDIEPDPAAAANAPAQRPTRFPVALVTLAVVALGAGVWARVEKDELRSALLGLFGPPPAELGEAYADVESRASFDHSVLDRVLEQHVDVDGWVDYEALRADPSALDAYVASLDGAPWSDLGRDERLALLLNAYNAFTLRLVLDEWPLESIRDLPDSRGWGAKRWRIGGRTLSLEEIEHGEIRPKFRDARIHFALVCAAVGCPPLRPEAYVAERLDAQLDEQARYVHSRSTWIRHEAGSDTIALSPLYSWYAGDFEQIAGSVLDYVARYSDPLAKTLDRGARPQVRWIEYDWALNSLANRRPR